MTRRPPQSALFPYRPLSRSSVPLSLDNGTDSGSGIDTASGVVERASAALTAGSCGSFGSWAPVSLSAGADAGVLSGNCYRYRYLISDKVGNQSSASAIGRASCRERG